MSATPRYDIDMKVGAILDARTRETVLDVSDMERLLSDRGVSVLHRCVSHAYLYEFRHRVEALGFEPSDLDDAKVSEVFESMFDEEVDMTLYAGGSFDASACLLRGKLVDGNVSETCRDEIINLDALRRKVSERGVLLDDGGALDLLQSIAAGIQEEFDDEADYIWGSPDITDSFDQIIYSETDAFVKARKASVDTDPEGRGSLQKLVFSLDLEPMYIDFGAGDSSYLPVFQRLRFTNVIERELNAYLQTEGADILRGMARKALQEAVCGGAGE